MHTLHKYGIRRYTERSTLGKVVRISTSNNRWTEPSGWEEACPVKSWEGHSSRWKSCCLLCTTCTRHFKNSSVVVDTGSFLQLFVTCGGRIQICLPKQVISTLIYCANTSAPFSSVQSFSRVWLFATPWTAARQASLSITNSWSLPKLMSIESVITI